MAGFFPTDLRGETIREQMPISPQYKQQGNPLDQASIEKMYLQMLQANPQLQNLGIDEHTGFNMRRAMLQEQPINPITGETHFYGNNKTVNDPRFAFELVDYNDPNAQQQYNTIQRLLQASQQGRQF